MLDSLIKLSLVQFLMRKKIEFEYKNVEILFNLLALDNKNLIGNSVRFIKDNKIVFFTYFSIDTRVFSKTEIISLVNAINNFAVDFNVSTEYNTINTYYQLLIIKSSKTLHEGQLISDEFWEECVRQNLELISNVINFVLNVYSTSQYKKREDLLYDKSFQDYVAYNLHNYIENLKFYRKVQQEQKEKSIPYEDKVKNMSKEEIAKELDSELSNFQQTGDDSKLNILSKYYS